MCINKWPVLWIVSFLLMIQISCGSYSEIPKQKPISKEAMLKYMESGFVQGYGTNRLFCDKFSSDKFSRIEILLDYLGYGDFEWRRFTISSDQKYLRFWQYKDAYLKRSVTRVLILGKGAEPKIYEFPEAAIGPQLDNNNIPVAWKDEKRATRKWIFANAGIVMNSN